MTLAPLCSHRLTFLECELSRILDIHKHGIALAELTLKQLQGQRVLQALLASCILPHVC